VITPFTQDFAIVPPEVKLLQGTHSLGITVIQLDSPTHAEQPTRRAQRRKYVVTVTEPTTRFGVLELAIACEVEVGQPDVDFNQTYSIVPAPPDGKTLFVKVIIPLLQTFAIVPPEVTLLQVGQSLGVTVIQLDSPTHAEQPARRAQRRK
jgi:hypothetical protein